MSGDSKEHARVTVQFYELLAPVTSHHPQGSQTVHPEQIQ